MKKKSMLSAALCAATLCMAPMAQATLVALDFDTPSTGANLGTSPLVTAAGTVTLSAIGAGSVAIAPNGHPTNGVLHVQAADTDRALLSFDFDVSSVAFDFAGEGAGNFFAELLDISGGVLMTFSYLDTSCSVTCFDGTVVLSIPGIRAFRFSDTPAGGNASLIDNLQLEAATVPAPGTLAGAGLALIGLGLARRKAAARMQGRKGVRT